MQIALNELIAILENNDLKVCSDWFARQVILNDIWEKDTDDHRQVVEDNLPDCDDFNRGMLTKSLTLRNSLNLLEQIPSRKCAEQSETILEHKQILLIFGIHMQ